MKNSALLIIDVQNDYFPGGRCELYQSNEAMEVIKQLIARFRKENGPIIYMQHINTIPGCFMEEGTVGSEIHPAIMPRKEDVVLKKSRPNSFYKTGLQEILKEQGITDLHVCGMMSHMCVDTTVRVASDLDYKVTVYANACTTMSLTWQGLTIPAETVHKAYMASLDGVFATVISN